MPARVLVRLMAQLTFGWDTVIGLGMYVLLSFLFQEPLNLWFLVWAVFCAYLPDLDFTYFIFQPKEVRKWGHWRLGFHHPTLFLPFVVVLAWQMSSWLFPMHELYLTTLAVVCVFGHFVHDSTKMGLHWFSPFTRDGGVSMSPLRWTSIQVTSRGLHILSQDEVEQKYAEIARMSLAGDVGSEVETRIEAVTTAQVACFTACIIGLIVLTVRIGYVPLW